MRLSIEITPDQHQRLKAAAALKEESIKGYVLKRTLSSPDEQSALQELEKFLKPRIEAADNGTLSTRSVDDIFDNVLRDSAE